VLGSPEILLILAIAVIFLGPERIPEVARTLGKATRQYRKFMDDFNRSIQSMERDVTKAADVNPLSPKDLRERDRGLILETAERMEIPTEGRSLEAVSEDIVTKAREKGSEKKKESSSVSAAKSEERKEEG